MQEGKEDTTFINEEEENPFEDQEVKEDSKEEGEEGEEGEDEKTKLEKKLKSQERKYDKLVGRNQELEKRISDKREPKELSEEDKKEKQAQDFIDKRARQVLKEDQEAKDKAKEKQVQELSSELDEVLEETDLSEKEILDLIEEFADDGIQLTPRQAATRLQRPAKKDVEKPKMPNAKRGTGGVKTEVDKKDLEGKSFQEKVSTITRKFLANEKEG